MLVFLCFSCEKTTESAKNEIAENRFEKIEQLHWLLGDWIHKTPEETSKETWRKANDSTYLGHSFSLIEKDTVFAERVTLQQTDSTLSFKVVAYKQNNNIPVTFLLNSTTDGVFSFENTLHDFPKRIFYSEPIKDSLHAWIDGEVNGKYRKIDFYFSRTER